jgi:hypothetical protein
MVVAEERPSTSFFGSAVQPITLLAPHIRPITRMICINDWKDFLSQAVCLSSDLETPSQLFHVVGSTAITFLKGSLNSS